MDLKADRLSFQDTESEKCDMTDFKDGAWADKVNEDELNRDLDLQAVSTSIFFIFWWCVWLYWPPCHQLIVLWFSQLNLLYLPSCAACWDEKILFCYFFLLNKSSSRHTKYSVGWLFLLVLYFGCLGCHFISKTCLWCLSWWFIKLVWDWVKRKAKLVA